MVTKGARYRANCRDRHCSLENCPTALLADWPHVTTPISLVTPSRNPNKAIVRSDGFSLLIHLNSLLQSERLIFRECIKLEPPRFAYLTAVYFFCDMLVF